jgi:heme exporter protein CcmD
MPDLGKYAVSVLTAYGLSGLILFTLVVQSWLRYQLSEPTRKKTASSCSERTFDESAANGSEAGQTCRS